MITTVFLSVLILALALGNIFLSLTSPKRLQREESQADEGEFETASVQDSFIDTSQKVDDVESQEVDDGESQEVEGVKEAEPGEIGKSRKASFEENAGMEKMDYLNKRVERLEQLLLKINNSKFVAQKINGTNLGQKLADLNEFKQNTRLEIAALKQRLDKVAPQEKKPKEKIPDISDEKLREIIFRANR